MEDRAFCCYHSNKDNFKSAMNDIRKMLHIPQSMSKVCAMAICTCRKRVTYRTPVYELEWDMFECRGNQDPNSHLSESLECSQFDYQIGNTTRDFILGIISDAEKKTESAMRLYHILKTAVDRDYTLLKEELDQTGRQPSEIKHVNKRKALHAILKKRKIRLGRSIATSIVIDRGAYRGVFRYDPGIKAILQKTAQQYKPCIIEIDKEKSYGMPRYMSSVPVKMWCRPKKLHAVVYQLRKELKLLPLHSTQKSRSIWWKCVYNTDSTYDDDLEIDPMDVKDSKSDDYCKKADRERSHHIRPLPGEKKSVKCYNCQKPLKTLPPLDDTKKDDLLSQECQYHPGFVQDGHWSCCYHYQFFEKFLPIAEQHALSGCAFDSHKWLYQDHSCKSKGVKILKENLNRRTGGARRSARIFANTDY